MCKAWSARFGWTLGVAAALAAAGQASAQEPSPTAPADINQRLERLEKINELLLKQNQDLKQELKAIKTQEVSTSTNGVDKTEVQNIVADYLKQQADKATTEKKDEWYQVGSDTKMPGYWGLNRLTFESANKDFKAHVGGRFQFDNYYIGVPARMIDFFGTGALDDNAFFRRVRLECDGKAYENIEWNFEIDFERNTLFETLSNGKTANGNFPANRFDELWVGITNLPILGNMRIGHVRPPQGLECYTSSRNLQYLERSSGFECFLQEFDPGIWFFNDFLDQRLFWATTVHRIDPSVQKAGESGKGDWAVTGRIAGLPVYLNDGRCLIHVGASYQIHSDQWTKSVFDRATSFSAPPDWRSGFFTPTMVATGTIIADHVDQYGLEALAIWGPVRVQAEYFGVHLADAGFPVAGGTAKQIGNANFSSGYVSASYLLTGENHRYDRRLGRIDRFVPNENFYLVKGEDGGWEHGKGAWEVLARWDYINLSNNDIKGGYMNNWTAGLNWYLNPNLKFQWNYTLTERNVDATGVGGGAKGPSGPLNAVGMRVQWEF